MNHSQGANVASTPEAVAQVQVTNAAVQAATE